jgi:outer membrane protein TolC
VLEVPLCDGGLRDAEVARERARLHELQAQLGEEELRVRQTVLELWLELDLLRAQRDEVAALGHHRELYLDRSRALYEMEVNADLGDSMTLISDHRLRQAATDFSIALAWARLDALTGKTPDADQGAAGGETTTTNDNDNDEARVP